MAGETNVADLKATLSADVSSFKTGLAGAQTELGNLKTKLQESGTHLDGLKDKAGGAGSSVKKAGEDAKAGGEGFKGAGEAVGGLKEKFGAMLGPLAALSAGIGAAFEIKGAIDKVQELGDNVTKLQRITGMSAEDASKLAFQWQETGVPFDTGVKAVDKLSKALSGISDAADGDVIPTGKAMTAMLKNFGVEAEDATGKQRPMIDVLGDMSGKLKDMQNPQDKVNFLMSVFGKSGAEMLPFFEKGPEGLKELSKEAEKFGLVLDQNTTDNLLKNKEATREWHAALEGIQVQIGILLLPVMTALTEVAVKVATALNQQVVPVIKTLAGLLSDLLKPAFEEIGDAISGAVDFVKEMVDGFTEVQDGAGGMGESFNDANDKIKPLRQMVADLSLAFRDQVVPALRSVVAYYNSDVKPALQDIVRDLKAVVDYIASKWPLIAPIVMDVLKIMFDQFKLIGTTLKDVFKIVIDLINGDWSKAWDDAKQLVSDAWDGIKSLIQDDLKLILDVLKLGLDVLKDAAKLGWDGIKLGAKEFWDHLVPDVIKGPLDTMKTLVEDVFKGLVDLVKLQLTAAKDAIKVVLDLIHGDWGKAWDDLKKLVSDVFDGIVTLVKDNLKTVNDEFGGIPGKLLEKAGDALNAAKTFGANIYEGIKDGISGIADWVKGEIDKFVQYIKDQVKDAVDSIASIPSSIPGAGIISGIGSTVTGILGHAGGARSLPGGRSMVGEYGPELVELPSGSNVYSNSDSRQMIDQGITVNHYGDINATSPGHARSAAEDLGFALKTAAMNRGLLTYG